MVQIALFDKEKKYRNEAAFALKNHLTGLCSYSIHEYSSSSQLVYDVVSDNYSFDIIIVEVTAKKGYCDIKAIRDYDSRVKIIVLCRELTMMKVGLLYRIDGFVNKGAITLDLKDTLKALIGRYGFVAPQKIKFKTRINGALLPHLEQEADIVEICRKNGLVVLHTYAAQIPIITKPLVKYQQILGNHFCVINRYHLVNMRNVKSIKGDYFVMKNYDLATGNPYTIKLSDTPKAKKAAIEAFHRYKLHNGSNPFRKPLA